MKRNSTHRSFGQASSLALAVALAIPAATALPAVAYAQEAQQDFNIAAGDLGAALQRYSAATGVQLVYSSDLVAGKRSSGVSGRMSPQQALGQLLAGSGLSARVSGNTATLVQGGSAGDVAAAEGERLLGPVRVEGSQGSPYYGGAGQQAGINGTNGSRDITATEGTGSFTSGALTIGSKAPQAIKDVPQSVSVLTSELLKQQNVTDINDAIGRLPGVSSIPAGGGSGGGSNLDNQFFSRGFEITTFQIDGGAPFSSGIDPATGSVGTGREVLQFDMAQYDHVELIRGAAGVLNGYGSPSGVINLVRKKPLNHPQILLEAQLGSWSDYRVMVDATAPLGLGGALRGRFVTTYQDRGYFYDTAKDNRASLYGVVELDLSPTVTVTGGASHARQKSVPFTTGLPRFATGDDLKLKRSTYLSAPWSRVDISTTELFAKIEKAISPDWNIQANVNRRVQSYYSKTGQTLGTVNPVTLDGPLFYGSLRDDRSRHLSAEATLIGAFEIFGQRQELTVGVSRSESNFPRINYAPLIEGFSPETAYIPYPGGPAYYYGSPAGDGPPVDVFNPDWSNPIYSEPSNSLPQSIVDKSNSLQTGAYLNLRLTAFDRLHLTTGFRWSRWKTATTSAQVCQSIPSGGTPGPANCVGRQIGDRFNEMSFKRTGSDVTWPPAVSISYDVTKALTAYVGYTDIYIDQSQKVDGNRMPLDPITGSNIEIGFKWSSRNGKFNAAASAYRIRQKGYGRDDFDLNGVPFGRYLIENGTLVSDPANGIYYYLLDNDGGRIPNGILNTYQTCCFLPDTERTLSSKGFDVDFSGELFSGLQVSGSLTFNENKQSGEFFAEGSGLPFISITPKYIYKLWASYDFDASVLSGHLSGLSVSMGLNGQSSGYRSGATCSRFLPVGPDGASSCAPDAYLPYEFKVKSYRIFSSMVNYKVSDIWAIALNIDNIFDKRYYTGTGGDPGFGNWYGTPRSFTASLRGKF